MRLSRLIILGTIIGLVLGLLYATNASPSSVNEDKIIYLRFLKDLIVENMVQCYSLGYTDARDNYNPSDRIKNLRSIYSDLFEEQIEKFEKLDEKHRNHIRD